MEKEDNMSELSIDSMYEEAGRQHRYFLAWREKLLAGYLSAIAAITYGLRSVYVSGLQSPHDPHTKLQYCLLLVAALVFSFIAFSLDTRTKALYWKAINAGSGLEPPDNPGFFSALRAQYGSDRERRDRLEKLSTTHTSAIRFLIAAVLLTAAVGLLLAIART